MRIESRSGRIRTALLKWYDANRRDLPWRATTDPYHIWISEVMLQQTRVDAVIPYYERWLAAFPDIDALANSDLQDVLKHWEGLGYYSRARNLHGAARLVRERHSGRLPSEYADLRALPGVGAYTAGAIASIAYKQKTPAVDGNVRRVVCRLFDVAKPTAAKMHTRANQLLAADRPGDFNQALMDLGATVCTPRDPRCGACPLAKLCRSCLRGTTSLRPARKRKKALPHFHVATLIVIRHGRVLVEQRGPNGLLGGLWQFPEMIVLPADARPLGNVTHTFSHKRITYTAYASHENVEIKDNQRWVEASLTNAYPMSAAQRKIEKLIGNVLL